MTTRALLVAAVAALLLASPTVAQERVTFPSAEGDIAAFARTMLPGFLYRPAGDGPFPAVVGMHGCGGVLTRAGVPTRSYAAWAGHLRAHGYVVLLVDGFTPRKAGDVCKQHRQSVSPASVRPRDAYGALLYLRGQPFVDAGRVALIGWSHGGGTVLHAAAGRGAEQAPGAAFAGVVALYPGNCREGDLGETWAPRMPLLVLVGELDDWTPAAPCRAAMDAARARAACPSISSSIPARTTASIRSAACRRGRCGVRAVRAAARPRSAPTRTPAPMPTAEWWTSSPSGSPADRRAQPRRAESASGLTTLIGAPAA